MFARVIGRLLATTVSAFCLIAVLNGIASPPATVAAVSALSSKNTPCLGAQPFVTLFCQFPNAPAREDLRAHYQRLLSDVPPGLAHYWKEVSYGRISLEGSRIAGWYRMPHPSDAYRLRPADPAALAGLAEDCTTAAEDDIFFPDFVGINLVFNRCPDTAYGGRIWLKRDGQEREYGVTWLCPGKYSWQSEVSHEMGHAFGLQHSADASGLIYSNPWDAMSACPFCRKQGDYGPVRQHPSAYQKDRSGWIPLERKYVAAPGSSAQVMLERLAQPQTGNYLMAVIPLAGDEGRYYTVEARRRIGYDRNLPLDAVVIHLIAPDGSPPAVVVSHHRVEGVFVDSAWTPGMVFSDVEHGVTVAVDAPSATGFVVTISNLRAD